MTSAGLWTFILDRIGIIGSILPLAAAMYVWYRTRSAWRAKDFVSQVNFSLNAVHDGHLVMRTLLETSTREVWINEVGLATLLRAAQRTTPSQPFVKLENPADMAFVKRAALNVLSQLFAATFVAQTLGLQTATATFCFAVTFERHGEIHTRKFRVLIVEAQELLTAFAPDAPPIQVFESPHEDRIVVLRAMREFALLPDNEANPVGRIELGHASGPMTGPADRVSIG